MSNRPAAVADHRRQRGLCQAFWQGMRKGDKAKVQAAIRAAERDLNRKEGWRP